MLECAGCGSISMGRKILGTTDGEVISRAHYPSPVERKTPDWVALFSLGFIGGPGEDDVGELLEEIYQAVSGRQYRLAAMGIRAVLEQVMIAKVGDLPTFGDKIAAFQTAGFISAVQKSAMENTLEVGHAAMHRAFAPTEKELNTSLDIVEGIFAAIYQHTDAALGLAKRIPPRSTRPKKS